MTMAMYFFYPTSQLKKKKAQTPVRNGIRARADNLQGLREHRGTQYSARAGDAHWGPETLLFNAIYKAQLFIQQLGNPR